MSHFSVIVIGEDFEKQLAPYHEYECTGVRDGYVVEVDEMEEARKEYQERTRSMVLHLVSGKKMDKHDFYRPPTTLEKACMGIGTGWSTLPDGTKFFHARGEVLFTPEGWEEIEVPETELQSFPKFVEYWYGHSIVHTQEEADEQDFGYVLVGSDGKAKKVVTRTNPNAKWDYYQIGGRWKDFFPTRNLEAADQALKRDIDIERAAREESKKATDRFDLWEQTFLEHGRPESFEAVHSQVEDVEEARERYSQQAAIQAYRNHRHRAWGCPVQVFGFDRETYVQDQAKRALVPYAFVKDGQWHGRGDMGWFGVSSNNTDQNLWAEQYLKMFESLPGDTILTMVDCHI